MWLTRNVACLLFCSMLLHKFMKRKTDPNPTTWPRRPHRWLWDSAEWEHSSTWEKLILVELTLKHSICCLGLASQLNSNLQCGMGVQHSPVGVWWFGCVVGGWACCLVLRTRHNLSRDTAKYMHDHWIRWYGVCGVVVFIAVHFPNIFTRISQEATQFDLIHILFLVRSNW